MELLEQTRGILVADTLDSYGSDLTQLHRYDPSLAEEFAVLRAHIDSLDSLPPEQPSGTPGATPKFNRPQELAQDLATARRDTLLAWNNLITRIRQLVGFDGFLLPPCIDQLSAQACDGPIIIPYTSASRCDALILTSSPDSPVHVVPLTGLTEDDVRERATRMKAANDFGFGTEDPDAEILDVLAWLWDTVAGPVLATLGYDTTPQLDVPWPRVWWCPVGPLADLPLHAAGHHEDAEQGIPCPRTVLDRVVSSYTTTIRGLAYARAQNLGPSANNTLIIATPDTPGYPPIRGIAVERDFLAVLIPGARILPNPTHNSVLAALPDYSAVHFACVSVTDPADPSASGLVLMGDDTPTSSLTVADIRALRLRGDLAYLSTNATSATTSSLVNEAVHISGAFYLAGYGHVISTFWNIADGVAVEITRSFYERLTRDGAALPNVDLAPYALHHAVRGQRDRRPRRPFLWGAFAHLGR